MIKPFLLLLSLLVLSDIGMVLHASLYNAAAQEKALSALTALSGFSAPCWSTAFYEPRLFLYDTPTNPAYPQMLPLDRMDFVYAK